MIRIALLDSVVAIQGPGDVLGVLSGLFPPASDAAATTAQLDVGDGTATWGAEMLPAPGPGEAVMAVATLVNQVVLAQCSSFAVHAAVVAKDARVVALCAPSGTGKSTLCAALLRNGWTYVSDEALVLEPDGHVRPYARPLALDAWSLDRLALAGPADGQPERLVLASELGAGTLVSPVPLTDVVELVRSSQPDLHSSRGPSGAATLLRYAFNHWREPRASFATATAAAARSWRLCLTAPEEAVQLLELRLL